MLLEIVNKTSNSMKKYIIISIVITAILLMVDCKKKDSATTPGSIYGTVTDKVTCDCVSAAGVELMPKGLKTVTGSDGSFQFTQVEPGEYNLFITKTGYQDLKSNTITVKSGEQAKGDVQIEKLPASLQIMDNDGQIISELNFGGDPGIISKTFKIINRGTTTLNFRINKYVEWIESITPSTGTIPVNRDCPIILKIDREKLVDGLNTTSIIITSEDGGVELLVKAKKGAYSDDVFELPAAHLMVQLEDLGCVNWSSAYSMCSSSTVAGYNDWRLPTKDELMALYNNREEIGGFTTGTYWSSTDYGNYYYGINFSNGNLDYYSYNNIFNVRAVRTWDNSAPLSILNNSGNEITELDFGSDANTTQKSFKIKNTGTQNISITITKIADWVSGINPISLELNAGSVSSIVVAINRELLADGNNSTSLLINTPNNGGKELVIKAKKEIVNGIFELTSANLMVQTQDIGRVNWTSANLMCQNSTLANYTDWRLPTQAELMILYNNRDIIGGFVTSINGAEYWSSQKNSDGNPVGVDFYNGSLFWYHASASYNVRAVRTLNGSSATEPTVTTSSVSNVTTNSAICGGNVTSDGGATVTARGVCWSTSSNPTINGNHTTDGTGTGTFTSSITGLAENTTYYVRAYATNSKGTAYGIQQSFTTTVGGSSATVPTVTTSTPSNVTTNSATCGGNVTSDGGATVTQRGVCYSTSQNPTTSDITVTSGLGIGSFSCAITGLLENTTYYVRAYAINSEGTAYGTQKSFTTTSGGGGGGSATPPTVTTVTPFDIAINSAACGGNVTSDGGATVFERGICYSTSQNPTTSNYTVQSGSGTGSYNCYMTGLNQNTTYYVRAYAINSEGTAYGYQESFTTNSEPINGWLYYDDGNGIDALGFNNGGTIYWANMFPSSMLTQYAGTNIVEIEALLNLAGTYTLQIYTGGTSAPGSLVATINVNHNYSDFGWYNIPLPNAVPLNTSQNLWVVLSKTHTAGEHPAGACADSGNPNGRWISDGSGTWEDLAQSLPYTWGIHTYVSNQTKSGKHGKRQIISAQIKGTNIPKP